MDLENMYQGVLTGTISLNADALSELQFATDKEIDQLFKDRGLLKKGEKTDGNE